MVRDEEPQIDPGRRIRLAMEGAVRAFERRIEDAPDDPTNYAHAAEWLLALWCYGFCTRAESFDKAASLIHSAMQLDRKSSHVHAIHGALCTGDWCWTKAESAFADALAVDFDCPNSHHWRSLYLSARGQHEEAIRASERAVELDPSPGRKTGLGASLYFARDFERLAATMQAVVDEAPDFAEGYDWLGMALVQLERFDESITAYEKANELSGGLAEINAGRGHAYGIAGRLKEAQQIAEQLERQSQMVHIPPVQMAFVYIGLGDCDRAFERLDRALDQRSWELAFVDVEPWLDPIRADPRFGALREVVLSG